MQMPSSVHRPLGVLVLSSLLGFSGMSQAQTWNFDIRLDGKPIGTHRFEVSGPADARTVTSDATMAVKMLGITVFRYRHQAQERWKGDCVDAVQSTTDDDGKAEKVDWRRDGSGSGSSSGNGSGASADGAASAAKGDCVMSYAYWHPALVQQTRLLNPQTGKMDEVKVERLPDATIQVAGREVMAARWQLVTKPPKGDPQRLTLWLDRSDQRWLGLDARVRGDRLLTYRLL
ncbi:DUF6134 family protein [Roseateles depolymerans]|uniref:Uncharacterized protein n=1 Tax=Roseateles depolymerans TaxID=76731 RepID=A0A0U3MYG9_9BURK|nr:DUF6134 family protein [Roseateles depolymerans]ALV06932.1 hypothetical protein RD2015_2464 [Roseateles depolymerans]REG19912.1 hypothetical protein DES44_2418 [Roseateles depolymerans]